MANGYFERGEIYWVKMGTGVGVEMNVTRPGLIVSSDKMNTTSDAAIVVFLTTKEHGHVWCGGNTFATGRESWIKCDQIQLVDKTRFTKYLGTVTPGEMREVESCLEDLFELGYEDTVALAAKDREIESRDVLIGDLRTEVAAVMARVNEKNEEIASLKMEIEMWQKCYGRCMDMLVDVKVNADVQRRTAVKEPEQKVVEMKQPEPPKEEPKEEPKLAVPEQETRLDINSCTATALKKVGFSLAMARKIVESRPFSSVEDIKRVNGLKASLYRVVEPKLCCVPVKVEEPPKVEEPEVKQEDDPGFEKLNLNTATAKELHDIAGIPQTTAYSITGYRKKNGPFSSIDDLLKVRNVFPGTIAKCREFLEV